MTETPTRDDDEGEDDEARREASPPTYTPKRDAATPPPPDWLTAQRNAIGTARPKPPPGVYRRGWRRSS